MRLPAAACALLACLAAPDRGTAQAADCAAPLTQGDLNFCAMEAWLAADDDLNAAYAEAVDAAEAFDPDGTEGVEALLRDAQRAWIVFRDAACDAEAALHAGGSMEPLIRATCLERLTVRRAEDLWTYAEN
jgi:uncharacterized protein YecT (DUF1311 family)